MKPVDFEYHRPQRIDDAVALLATLDGAVPLAGGQSLVLAMNLRQATPAALVDLNRIPELVGIRPWPGGLAVGAMTRQRDVEISPAVRAGCPLVAEALAFVGHVPTRNRGTVGGSIAHGDPLAELPTAALALDAELTVVSGAGPTPRTVSACEVIGPDRTSTLDPAELVTEVRFPVSGPGDGSAFEEAEVVRVAVDLHVDGDQICQRARIALGGVAAGPVRAQQAETVAVGRHAGDARWAEVADAAVADLDPPDDADAPAGLRRDLARELVRRGLARALDHACTTQET